MQEIEYIKSEYIDLIYESNDVSARQAHLFCIAVRLKRNFKKQPRSVSGIYRHILWREKVVASNLGIGVELIAPIALENGVLVVPVKARDPVPGDIGLLMVGHMEIHVQEE